jgi:hypothetical protein
MKTVIGLLKSKTFWFNVITGTLSIVDSLNGNAIPVQYKAAIIAIGNVFLRLITTTPVETK